MPKKDHCHHLCFRHTRQAGDIPHIKELQEPEKEFIKLWLTKTRESIKKREKELTSLIHRAIYLIIFIFSILSIYLYLRAILLSKAANWECRVGNWRLHSMILEHSSGGMPFNLVSSSRTTCFTNLIEFY